MKTLVIHPTDDTTDFLSHIYKDKDFTILTGNIGNSEKRKLLKEFDRIIMLGHGTKDGLFGHKKFMIDSNDVATLKEKEIIHKLKELQKDGDIEINHQEADQILCDFLLSLGYERIVKEFAKIEKWYA